MESNTTITEREKNIHFKLKLNCLERLRNTILNNRYVSYYFRLSWYKAIGNYVVMKLIPDVQQYLVPLIFIDTISKNGWTIQVGEFSLTWQILLGLFIIMNVIYIIAGFSYRHSGLYEKEAWTDYMKNPINKEMIETLRILKQDIRKLQRRRCRCLKH